MSDTARRRVIGKDGNLRKQEDLMGEGKYKGIKDRQHSVCSKIGWREAGGQENKRC